MKDDPKIPYWILWILANAHIVIPAVGVSAMIIVILVSHNLNQRIDSLEGMLKHDPPRNYQTPNLAQYQAEKIDTKSIQKHKFVYIPIYSHVYADHGRPYLLEATLSIRNTDINKSVYIRSVHYFNTRGDLVKKYVDQLIKLRPLETIDFLVKARDTTGGSGANFIVEWLSLDKVEEPIIEAVMVGSIGAQGISFVSRGQSLSSVPKGLKDQ
ncbi:MAG: DUF3124 domain-containing protein [Desulfobacteraceae bacterium]